MRMKTTLKRCAATAAFGALMLAGPALAQDSAKPTFKVGMCYDLSKSYTFVTPQIAQAAQDLFALTNMQGGIGGMQIEAVVRDHGNEPQRGIECYERLRREGVFVFDVLSTPVSIALVPRVMKDKNVLVQALVGRGDAINGDVFQWVFPQGPTYVGQAANDVAFLKEKNGGSLKGKSIGFVYLDYPFGQEPIEILKTLAKRENFDLKLYPVALPGTDQSGVWTQVRRDKPDHMIAWLLAGQHVIAAREMKRNGFPTDKYIAVNWLNEVDIANMGEQAAKGLMRGTNVVGGQDLPIIKKIKAELYDKGKGSGPAKTLNDVYYNTGLAIYSVLLEAARKGVEKHGLPLTAEKLKSGYESIKDFDANGLMAPLTITASDHGGGGKTRVEQWNGEKWVSQTDWLAAYQDLIWETVKESSSKFKVD